MPSLIRISFAILFACLTLGCAGSNLRSADPLKTILNEKKSGAAPALNDAVNFKCTIKDGIFKIVFTTKGGQTTVAFERAATIYWLASTPLLVVIHEEYASNEDRLLLCDLANPNAPPTVTGHGDPGSYSHSHFAVKGGREGQILVDESQYAGDTPARRRRLRLPMKVPLAPIVGEWRLR